MSYKIRKTSAGIWVIDGDTHMTKWVEETGRIDHDRTVDRILNFIPEGGVVVDAGASIGDHTVPYARKVGKGGLVIAFEPNQPAHECLEKNKDESNLTQIYLMRYGLSNGISRMMFKVDDRNFGASHIAPDGEVEIKTMALDQLAPMFTERGRFDFFKLDVEGMELKALEGAAELIDKYRPRIYCEINDGALRAQGCDRSKIFTFLEARRYSVEPFTGNLGCTQFDIMATPK